MEVNQEAVMAWRVAMVVLLAAPAALAQGLPAQEGNIYNGREHQPVAGATNQAEQAAGVATPGAQQQQTSAVESLNAQVQQNAATGTGPAAGCTADKTKCSR
jgi:hypothetical protein